MAWLLLIGTGAAALICSAVWMRALATLLGSTAAVQEMGVLVFLGGFALGARLIGAKADRVAKPLGLAGRLLLVLAGYAAGFDLLLQQVGPLVASYGYPLLGSPWLVAAKLGLVLLLLLLPAWLLGSVLPLVAAWFQQQHADASRRAVGAYAAGAFGATAGAAVAGFYLVRELGLAQSLWVGAGISGLVGLLAIGAGRMQKSASNPALKARGSTAESEVTPGMLTAACYLVAFAGLIVVGLEVLTVRALSIVAGGSHDVRTLVLIVCLLGIGSGAAVVASPGLRSLSWGPAALTTMLVAALWIGGLALVIGQWADVFRHWNAGIVRSETGYGLSLAIQAGLAFLVLGVPAGLLGALLPLSLRLLGGREWELARRVGRLMAWKALGAFAGIWVASQWLLPVLGLRASYLTLAIALCVAVALLALSGGRTMSLTGSLLLAVGLFWGGWSTGGHWRVRLSGGPFRIPDNVTNPTRVSQPEREGALLYYQDGPDATVSVEAGPARPPFGTNCVLQLNGANRASSTLDFSRHVLTGHLPLLSRPGTTNVFILGWGGGGTAGAVLQHRVQSLVVAERFSSVLPAARYFSDINLGAMGDPRLTLVPDDGRLVLKLSRKSFGVIISEAAEPWEAGGDGFFTREFYAICKRRLKQDGLMAQWVPAGRMGDAAVLQVLRTFNAVFPQMEIWDTSDRDLLLLGGAVPWPTGTNVFRTGFERDGVRQQLRLVGLSSPPTVWARQLASQRTAWAIAGEGPILHDGNPTLSFRAPIDVFVGASASSLLGFDERMRWHVLAPEEKQIELATLSEVLLGRIFDSFGSYQNELAEHVADHRSGSDVDGSLPVHSTPCIFQPGELATNELFDPGLESAAGSAQPEWAKLMQRVRTGGEDWARATAEVLTLLQSRSVSHSDLDETAVGIRLLAQVTATVALREGEPALAAEVLREADRLVAEDRVLDYLRRIAEREAPLRTGIRL